jgi:hypothetical protein
VARKSMGAGALALAAAQCWGQAATPPTVLSPGEAPGVQVRAAPEEPPIQATPPTPPGAGTEANGQVLQAWQEQTGQAVWVKEDGQLEFHGATSLDVYGNSVNVPSGNPALSSLREGNKARGIFQGDIRTTSPEGDVTYLQGVVTSTNDRGVQSRYATQVNTLQVGRAGVGYQLAFGDVVAGFSNLSSNLGLRGALLTKEIGAFTLTGFAGTVADSWESLSNTTALDGLPPRSRYLRDVYGAKGDYRYSAETNLYATLQAYRDRTSSAPVLPGLAAMDGKVFTFGGKQQVAQGQWSAEAGKSQRTDLTTGNESDGRALTLDGSYRWTSLGVRAGFHDLSAAYASLAQTVAPGVREFYVGGDWSATPQLNLSMDVRHAITRLLGGPGFPEFRNDLDTFNTRVSYSVLSLPGLMLSLSDTRSKGEDSALNQTRNEQQQASAAYGMGMWNGQLSIGTGESSNSASALANSTSRQWQASIGRTFSDVSVEVAPAWTVSTQLFTSSQIQKFAAGEVRSRSIGLNVSMISSRWGNLAALLQRQKTTQVLAAAPGLSTSSFTLDWTRQFTPQWTGKAYARVNHRNHGDFALQADERVIGVQGAYQW